MGKKILIDNIFKIMSKFNVSSLRCSINQHHMGADGWTYSCFLPSLHAVAPPSSNINKYNPILFNEQRSYDLLGNKMKCFPLDQ